MVFVYACGNKSEKVLQKLRTGSVVYTSASECMLQCLNVSKKEVRTLLDSGVVDFDSSNLKGKDPIYYIKPSGDADLRIMVSSTDSNTNVLVIKREGMKDTCRCN
jgi:hypothetical protein